MRPVAVVPTAMLVAIAGCSESPSSPGTPPEPPPPDPGLGRVAFQQECARCHASQDGLDLAYFGFSDTTIIRRAVAHVDTGTARNIVAHVRSIGAPYHDEETRLFQPGGAPLADDVEFAVALFGRDEWPSALTSAELGAVDPRQVRIAVRLPVWSDELSNLDWMPDMELPPAILEHAGSQAAGAVAGYRAVPTQANLARAVVALRQAERAASNPGAPCLLEDSVRVRFRECFEARRWTSTLVAQHMFRYGLSAPLGPDLHDVWWDVGNAARKSRMDRSQPIARPVENWASWMFLGWSFAPSHFPSVYTGGGFRALGLPRHATFVALRSQVARPRNSLHPYHDLVQAVRFSPPGWTTSATSFGLRHLLERLQEGDRPLRQLEIDEAAVEVNTALLEASRRISVADLPGIQALAGQVLAALAQ